MDTARPNNNSKKFSPPAPATASILSRLITKSATKIMRIAAHVLLSPPPLSIS